MNTVNTVKTITLQANAKINLLLDITGRRPDGYHTITGVMQAVSLADTVTVTASGEGAGRPTITLACSDPTLPTDGKNLAWRAAEVFFTVVPSVGCDALTIDIDKRIPAAAGMAGGSTDAAATLRALNDLFDHPLSEEQLLAVGLSLGADVPFCLVGGTQLTEGVGERMTPLCPLPACAILVACAGEGISTPAAYRALDERYGNFAPNAYAPHLDTLAALNDALTAGNLAGVCAHTFNLFETVILPAHPTACRIKETLLAHAAITAMMSGSGPSVFGIFASDNEAARAADALREQGIHAYICHAI